jgi:dienelactone hydrolase
MTPATFLGLMAAALANAEPVDAPAEVGEVRFASDDAANNVPDRYRLAPHSFPYTVTPRFDLPTSNVEVFDVLFPSAVASPHPANNTVHCEYFKPGNPGRHPAVVVLDILDGKQLVSRGKALWLAQNDIPALVVILPYYGPRRPPGTPRMISTDVAASLDNVRQAVLDCRRAAAWLGTRPEVDADRLGIVGTSLGSFMAALTAESEPRLKTVCLLLGGGGLVDAFYDHPKAAPVVVALHLFGLTKDYLRKQIAVADPLTYADRLKAKRLLLIGASRDDVVPPVALKRLWEATGKGKIVWFDATHVGAAMYALPAMNEVIGFIKGTAG